MNSILLYITICYNTVVNVIAPRRIREFWLEHDQAEAPLRVWLRMMQKASYRNLNDVRADFPTADLAVTEAGNRVTIFNIGGNDFRLVTFISYKAQRVYLRRFMTHAEYSRWNRRGRPE